MLRPGTESVQALLATVGTVDDWCEGCGDWRSGEGGGDDRADWSGGEW